MNAELFRQVSEFEQTMQPGHRALVLDEDGRPVMTVEALAEPPGATRWLMFGKCAS